MTQRLELSVPTERDVEDIVAYANDPDVIAYTPVPVPYGRREALEWIVEGWDAWRRGERLGFAIRLRDDPRLLGTVVLFGFRDRAAELGYAMHPRVAAARARCTGASGRTNSARRSFGPTRAASRTAGRPTEP
ncbi:MAG: GNAT family N-acetyltransferase [Williamsia herbipolensis]|nr:GNAT family N-acetyltransferase [Williamsia herbipolensis]